MNDRACEARVLSALPSPEPCAKVTLIQGLPKSDKLEWIVQKATELGVWALWPVEMTRCVARGGKDQPPRSSIAYRPGGSQAERPRARAAN